MSKKGIDPLFWWGVGTISAMVLAGVGYGIATSTPELPIARRAPQAQPEGEPNRWLRVGQTLLGVAPAVSLAFMARGKGNDGEPGAGSPVPASPPPTAPAAEQAVKRVTTYTHDRETAIRLLMATADTHRTRPLDWVADKVIHDLVRDRRP